MKERELFEWLKEKHFPDLEHSPQVYDGFDCVTKKFGMFIELKSRNTHYDTLLLEKKKFDFLVTKAKELGLTAWYVNYTPSGVWSFKLDDENDFVWEDKWLPVTTEFTNKSKIMKQVTFLPLSMGIQIK
jgi:hypothetical protein